METKGAIPEASGEVHGRYAVDVLNVGARQRDARRDKYLVHELSLQLISLKLNLNI